MDGVHLHLMLTHVPVIGTIFAIGLLVLAVVKRSSELARVSFGAFVLLALIAVVVFLTGEAAEEVAEGLPGVSEAIIERHEEAALIATIALGAFGALALGALIFLRRGISRGVMLAALLLSLVPAGALAWTANLGGQVRHTEIRPGAAFLSENQGDPVRVLPDRRGEREREHD